MCWLRYCIQLSRQNYCHLAILWSGNVPTGKVRIPKESAFHFLGAELQLCICLFVLKSKVVLLIM